MNVKEPNRAQDPPVPLSFWNKSKLRESSTYIITNVAPHTFCYDEITFLGGIEAIQKPKFGLTLSFKKLME